MKKMFKEPQISIAWFDEISCAGISGTGGGTESGTNLAKAESSLSGNVTKQDISKLLFE